MLVAMDHAASMGVGGGLAHLLKDCEESAEVVDGIGPLLQQRREASPLDQPHREVGPQVGIEPQFVYRKDAWVLELPADLRLLDEPADQRWIAGAAGVQNLHRDVAAEVGVTALKHDTHLATRDLAEELIPPLSTGEESVLRGSDHRRGRVRLVAQQDLRCDARRLPDGFEYSAPVLSGGRGCRPKRSPKGRIEVGVGFSIRGHSVGINRVIHGDSPSRFFGPYSWFIARAVFAHSFSGSSKDFAQPIPAGAELRGRASSHSSNESNCSHSRSTSADEPG